MTCLTFFLDKVLTFLNAQNSILHRSEIDKKLVYFFPVATHLMPVDDKMSSMSVGDKTFRRKAVPLLSNYIQTKF